MAASRSETPAAADQLMEPSMEEMCFPAENKELIVTMTVEELDVQSNSAAADTREEEEEEATPTPPESSSLSPENGTVTVATREEESLSVMLNQIKTDRQPDREGEPGKGRGQVQLFP